MLRLSFWGRSEALRRALVISLIAVAGGCRNEQVKRPVSSSEPSAPGAQESPISAGGARLGDAILLENAAVALNNLADGVVLDLAPPQPILTAANSADGQEVRATCGANPQTPASGEFNYLASSEGNANFASIGVRPGDLVRFFINVDERELDQGPDEGMQQRKAIELTVRRLDDRNPENALIIEGGLAGPVNYPERIEIWRISDARMNDIRRRLETYAAYRQPIAGWEPAPDEEELAQVVDRFNSWYRNQPTDANWRPSPLLETLPQDLRSAEGLAELIATEALRASEFGAWEGRELQQSLWCRDISQWARGDAKDDAQTAAALFDWTVRNIGLETEEGVVGVFRPWQALLHGRGRTADRAWTFVELCRCQRIDACVLTLAREVDAPPARMLVAALVDGRLLLFDPELGLPLPGETDSAVAALDELRKNPAWLRKLDVAGGPAYAVQPEDLAHAKAWLIATPTQLARRSAMVEDALDGDRYVALTVDVDGQAERFGKLGSLDGVGLWPYPWQATADQHRIKLSKRAAAVAQFLPYAQIPQLWKARALHFQGNRPVPADLRDDPLAKAREGHLQALGLYQDPKVRPPDRFLKQFPQERRAVHAAAKRDAAFWIGLLCYDRGDFESCQLWLDQLLLQPEPDGPRAPAARYNLARCFQAQGDWKRAAQLLRTGVGAAPSQHGNLVLAQRLEQLAAEEEKSTPPQTAGENAE